MGRIMKIIAEMCQNHNGKKQVLQKMVEVASKSGADICKIQSIKARDLIYWEEFEKFRPYEKEYERLKSLELSIDDEKRFVDVCYANGVTPMTTIFNPRDWERFNNIGYSLLKVSGYSIDKILPELKHYNFNHVYISTSSKTLKELQKVKDVLKKHDISEDRYTILNCTCIYPTPLEKLNLQNINYYRDVLGFKNVGLSDHSNPYEDNLLSSKLAIFQGIDALERHFTILKPEETRDGKVSINPPMLTELSRFSRLTKEQQYEELNEFNEKQKFNHHYYRNRF